jgi:formylglycine-generating enzyme required for sulfatase activity
MVGNVWELTADLFRGPHPQPGELPEPGQVPSDIRAGVTRQRVIKGGSFLCAPNYCMRYRSGARQPQEEDLGASHLGFRTILNAAPP